MSFLLIFLYVPYVGVKNNFKLFFRYILGITRFHTFILLCDKLRFFFLVHNGVWSFVMCTRKTTIFVKCINKKHTSCTLKILNVWFISICPFLGYFSRNLLHVVKGNLTYFYQQSMTKINYKMKKTVLKIVTQIKI